MYLNCRSNNLVRQLIAIPDHCLRPYPVSSLVPSRSLSVFSVRSVVTSRPPPLEAPRIEQPDRVPGRPFRGEVGHDFANHRGELIAMPREPGSDRHLWRIRQSSDHEMLVWRVGIHAGLGLPEGAIEGRDPA